MFEWVARTINGREAGVLHCKSPEKVTMRRGGSPNLRSRLGTQTRAAMQRRVPSAPSDSLSGFDMDGAYLPRLLISFCGGGSLIPVRISRPACEDRDMACS